MLLHKRYEKVPLLFLHKESLISRSVPHQAIKIYEGARVARAHQENELFFLRHVFKMLLKRKSTTCISLLLNWSML